MGGIRRKNTQRIVVAMSGGVDSSVAAALLKRAGFDIVGVFMKFWSEGNPTVNSNRCCSSESEVRAREVARKLNIPFYVLNLEKEFKKKVVDYFLSAHKEGVTPNPCVVCNKEIKFGLLLEKASAWGASLVATGHYARKIFDSRKNIYKLQKGTDKNKDQSYFLWMLNQKQLARTLFPVGDYRKSEVRKLAKKFGLSTSETPDSQEICFIPGEINEFLKRHLKVKPGKIVDIKGRMLGEHNGLHFFTLGQRKGINLPRGPYYVLNKNPKNDSLIITKDKKDLLKGSFRAKKLNWISAERPQLPAKLKVKIRYRSKEIIASVELADNNLKVIFNKPQRAVTPGQSAVFYKGQELLGGGIII